MTASIELIVGNSNKRFSGVTSTMLQLLPHQQRLVSLAVLGDHHLPDTVQHISYRGFLRMARKPLKDGRPRVFHARRNDEMIQALIAKRIFGAKIKIAFTSTAQRQHSKFTQWLMKQMDAIISTSDAAAAYLSARQADIIIPHGIDTSVYTPPASRPLAWQNLNLPGKFGIGVFGRVRQSKGIDILVDAAIPLLKKIPDATVVICGECLPKDHAFKTGLSKKIHRAGLSERFVFLGKQPFGELPALFGAMSVVVALSRNEGFGLTPLEAMASGCAVLTSEAGAWKQLIRNGIDGYCVETGNIAATQEKLALLLNDLAATHRMGESARAYIVDNHTVEKEAATLTDFLQSLTRQVSLDPKKH